MPMDLYTRALEEYVVMGGTQISFTPVVGDPLVDPHILERIRMAVGIKQITSIYFHTNGILLNRHKMYEKLLKSGLMKLYVSTAGFDREMFERVYRNKKYDELLEGVSKLLKRNIELGEPVKIFLELRPDKPIDEVLQDPDFVEHISPHLPESRINWLSPDGYDNWGGMITQEQLTGNMRLATPVAKKRRPCLRTFSLSVIHDGQVRACSCRFIAGSFDDLCVGDINDGGPLEDVWKGEKVRELRRSFVNDDLKTVCQSCTWYEPI